MSDQPELLVAQDESVTLRPRGPWTVAHSEVLEGLCTQPLPSAVAVIDLGGVTALDTVGAWLFEKLLRRFSSASTQVALVGVSESYAGLMREMRDFNRRTPVPRLRSSFVLDFLERIGRGAVAESAGFLQMLGAVSIALLGVLRHPRSLRLTPTIYQLYRVGWRAIPIMASLGASFSRTSTWAAVLCREDVFMWIAVY